MKKILHSILFACMSFTVISCGHSNKLTSLDEFNLKGNVSSIRVITYEAKSKFGDIIKGDVDFSGNYQYEFDEKNMTTRKTIFDCRGNIDNKDIYTYNDINGLSEICTYNSDGDLKKKIIFEYVDEILFSQNFYNAEGESINKIEFENDGKNITKGKLEDGSYWVNAWNGNKLNKSVNYKKNGAIESTSLYTDEGKLSHVILENYEISLTYNESGDIISYVNAEPYDLVGFILENGDSYSCEYEYDSHENWVKRISYLGETRTPHKIVERNICYFD